MGAIAGVYSADATFMTYATSRIGMRKVKRHKNFELSLQLTDGFIRPPRDAQRNWLMNRLLKELSDDLEALDASAKTFVKGAEPADMSDRSQAALEDTEIMEDWQIDVMRAMATEACATPGDILEIGFGRGVASDFIQAHGVRSHTIIECNPTIIERAEQWRGRHSDRDIRVVPGLWQDTIGGLGQFDGIFFHTYPLNHEEFIEYVFKAATFAEHFFDAAAAHLKPGGNLTYMTMEIDSLSRGHQRALLRRFRTISMRRLTDLGVPDSTRDAQWAQETIIIRASK